MILSRCLERKPGSDSHKEMYYISNLIYAVSFVAHLEVTDILEDIFGKGHFSLWL